MIRLAHRLHRDERGATLIEFAIIALPFFSILLGLMDFGYRSYATSVVEGTLQRAARLATIGNKSSTEVDTFVKDELKQFSTRATVVITKTNYYQFSGVGKSEKLVTDTAPLGTWNAGDCYEDLNGNGKWDAVAGRDGLGGSDDIVYYKVEFTYPRLMPMAGLFGWSNSQKITVNTVMRNQPYASQTVPTQKCTST